LHCDEDSVTQRDNQTPKNTIWSIDALGKYDVMNSTVVMTLLLREITKNLVMMSLDNQTQKTPFRVSINTLGKYNAMDPTVMTTFIFREVGRK